MDIRTQNDIADATQNESADATPRSIIKSDTIISQVVGTIDEETKNCFTRIGIFFKKMVYCECQSSSNCVKHKK